MRQRFHSTPGNEKKKGETVINFSFWENPTWMVMNIGNWHTPSKKLRLESLRFKFNYLERKKMDPFFIIKPVHVVCYR